MDSIKMQVGINRGNQVKYIYVQSVLPEEDVIALKAKSGESSIKNAIAKAVYYYLDCSKEEF